MLEFALFLIVPVIVGLCFVVREIRNAPEGFQDDFGFTPIWRNNSPTCEDVSCVWSSLASTSAADGAEHGAACAA